MWRNPLSFQPQRASMFARAFGYIAPSQTLLTRERIQAENKCFDTGIVPQADIDRQREANERRARRAAKKARDAERTRLGKERR